MRLVPLMALGFVGSLWVPSPSKACSCLVVADLVWPASGASAIATQPDIVVRRDPRLGVTTFLRDPQGHEVALALQGVGTISNPNDCGSELAFLTTTSELAANTQYQVVSRLPEGSTFSGLVPSPALFTTGEPKGSGGAGSAAAAVGLRFFRVIAEACVEGSVPCGEFIQVQSTVGAFDGASWLRLTATRNGQPTNAVERLTHDAVTLLPIDPNETCVSYERVGTRGQVLETGRACTQEKCLRIARSAEGAWDGCSVAAPLPSSVFDLVGTDSCSAPPLVVRSRDNGYELASSRAPSDVFPDATVGEADSKPDTGPETTDASSPSSEAAVDDISTKATDEGCSLGVRHDKCPWFHTCTAMLFGVLLVRRVHRLRSAR